MDWNYRTMAIYGRTKMKKTLYSLLTAGLLLSGCAAHYQAPDVNPEHIDRPVYVSPFESSMLHELRRDLLEIGCTVDGYMDSQVARIQMNNLAETQPAYPARLVRVRCVDGTEKILVLSE